MDEKDQVFDTFISILVIHRMGTVLACNCLFSGISHAELGYEPSLSFSSIDCQLMEVIALQLQLCGSRDTFHQSMVIKPARV